MVRVGSPMGRSPRRTADRGLVIAVDRPSIIARHLLERRTGFRKAAQPGLLQANPLHVAQLIVGLCDGAGDLADAGDEAPHGRRVYGAGILDLNSPANFSAKSRDNRFAHTTPVLANS